jgi:hypothetical protein
MVVDRPRAVSQRLRCTMTGFHTTQPVRLIEAERARQMDIGDAVGRVLSVGDNSVEVDWPRFRSWHKASDLEPAS